MKNFHKFYIMIMYFCNIYNKTFENIENIILKIIYLNKDNKNFIISNSEFVGLNQTLAGSGFILWQNREHILLFFTIN